jgi:hypothetical protein
MPNTDSAASLHTGGYDSRADLRIDTLSTTRCDPEATVVYSAPDELDLFLYFFEKGLYVAPDPELMKRDLSYITEARTGDVRRRRNQGRQYSTSRTDPLDAWYYFSRGESEQPASKPAPLPARRCTTLSKDFRSVATTAG